MVFDSRSFYKWFPFGSFLLKQCIIPNPVFDSMADAVINIIDQFTERFSKLKTEFEEQLKEEEKLNALIK